MRQTTVAGGEEGGACDRLPFLGFMICECCARDAILRLSSYHYIWHLIWECDADADVDIKIKMRCVCEGCRIGFRMWRRRSDVASVSLRFRRLIREERGKARWQSASWMQPVAVGGMWHGNSWLWLLSVVTPTLSLAQRIFHGFIAMIFWQTLKVSHRYTELQSRVGNVRLVSFAHERK